MGLWEGPRLSLTGSSFEPRPICGVILDYNYAVTSSSDLLEMNRCDIAVRTSLFCTFSFFFFSPAVASSPSSSPSPSHSSGTGPHRSLPLSVITPTMILNQRRSRCRVKGGVHSRDTSLLPIRLIVLISSDPSTTTTTTTTIDQTTHKSH
jgi:hypothetical protein